MSVQAMNLVVQNGKMFLRNPLCDVGFIEIQEVVHGEWVKIDKRGKNVQCSKCGNTLDLRGVNTGRGDANYCPNCGARMGNNDAIPFNARWEIDERELGGYDS